MGNFMEQSGIPMLLALVCIYVGVKLIVTKDISSVRRKDAPPVKDENAYAKQAGTLIIVLGVASLVMIGLAQLNVYVALAEMVVSAVVIGILWKRMNNKYGA